MKKITSKNINNIIQDPAASQRDPDNPFEVAADGGSRVATPAGGDYVDLTGEYFEAEFMPRDCLEPPSREMLR
jgi:hypothetical protein